MWLNIVSINSIKIATIIYISSTFTSKNNVLHVTYCVCCELTLDYSRTRPGRSENKSISRRFTLSVSMRYGVLDLKVLSSMCEVHVQGE